MELSLSVWRKKIHFFPEIVPLIAIATDSADRINLSACDIDCSSEMLITNRVKFVQLNIVFFSTDIP